MKLVYLGSEVPSNRKILESLDISDMGFSFWRLRSRGLPKIKTYTLSEFFSPSVNVHVYPGIPETKMLSPLEIEDFVADFEDFLAHNMGYIASFSDFNHPLFTKGFIEHERLVAFNEEEKFRPVWTPRYNYADLSVLTSKNKSICVPSDLIDSDPSIAQKIKALKNQNEVEFHALAYAKPEKLRGVPWTSASTMSWLSPMMRGETIVWDNNRLVRYNKDMKSQARPRYKSVCEEAGLDFVKILNDDPIEVSKLAIWSYKQFEKRFNMVSGFPGDELYDNLPLGVSTENMEFDPPIHDKRGVEKRKLQARNPAEMGNLPVFGVESKTIVERDEEGRDVIQDVPILTSNSVSLRQCNTCFVASNCPAFKPDTVCAFKLPVEIKTKEQMKALINTIIEMQGQRVAFARFSEEMNGGYPDPNTSQEIDRLFKLIKTVKELDDSSSFIKMTLEGRSSGAGVLSQIFGEKAKTLNELPNQGLSEQDADTVIRRSIEDQ